jgi:nicotinamidase-related amidase
MRALLILTMVVMTSSGGNAEMRIYENRLTRVETPKPLVADYPQFIAPVNDTIRYEAPAVIDDDRADLDVRTWRYSYNARAIIEMPNRLRAKETAVIVVHPWGIDDGQGWKTPEPAGIVDFCTPEKNALAAMHTREVINPLLKSLRGKVELVMYSLPGEQDAIRKKMYRSVTTRPSELDRQVGRRDLEEKLQGFSYRGEAMPEKFELSKDRTVADYFRQFPGVGANEPFNPKGFWELPIPVTKDIDVEPEDVVIYDGEGYERLRDFLKQNGVRHVLLAGYATDMCYRKTTAGFENLDKDFNVILIGDATLATFPANANPRAATNAAISYAALDHLITQVSFIHYRADTTAADQQ